MVHLAGDKITYFINTPYHKGKLGGLVQIMVKSTPPHGNKYPRGCVWARVGAPWGERWLSLLAKRGFRNVTQK